MNATISIMWIHRQGGATMLCFSLSSFIFFRWGLRPIPHLFVSFQELLSWLADCRRRGIGISFALLRLLLD